MRSVIVTLQVEGIHCWPACPFPEVGFLEHSHRHIFYITVEKEVTHDDRDIEIIMLKREVDTYIHSFFENYYGMVNFRWMSCEMIAQNLLNRFDLLTCQVLEDNENGAKIYK